MPRYFIDTYDQDNLCQDEEGWEFADLAAAKDAAIIALPGIAKDALPNGDSRVFLAIVRGEDGNPLLHVSLTLNVLSIANDLER